MERIPVLVCAMDPISKVGVAAALRSRPEVLLLDDETDDPRAVVMVVADRIDDAALRLLRGLHARGLTRTVLVTTDLDDSDLLSAVEVGVCAVARRAEATPEALVRLATIAAAGEGVLPPDLLGRLLSRVSRLQRQVLAPQGLNLAGLSDREVEVLKLVAAGLDTREIAEKLCYSQRTVKSILHDVTSRFQLKNRSHAVAYAMREGLI